MHLSKVLPAAHKGRVPAHEQLRAYQRSYAIAKVAGLKLCEGYNRQHGTRYISVMSERQR
ncbi:NAD-dependent epimerase/dehydratase family protein [Paraburkholderia sp. CI3]|uniref:NAD-dependent epimerase/dehydratase family protein n=1 Tax=Paraburkholderia sp. CI3 TaxID=2991060 RepID=UPI003D231DAB